MCYFCVLIVSWFFVSSGRPECFAMGRRDVRAVMNSAAAPHRALVTYSLFFGVNASHHFSGIATGRASSNSASNASNA